MTNGTPTQKHDWYIRNKVLCDFRSRKYIYTPFGKLVRMYLNMKQRVLGQDKKCAHKYKGLPLCQKEAFYNKFKNDPHYLNLFTTWKNSGFQLKLSPSIDRIINSKGYALDNIQILTQSENRKKEGRYYSLHREGHPS